MVFLQRVINNDHRKETSSKTLVFSEKMASDGNESVLLCCVENIWNGHFQTLIGTLKEVIVLADMPQKPEVGYIVTTTVKKLAL